MLEEHIYFFEDNFKDHESLNNIEFLVDELQWTMLRIKGEAIDSTTFKVDYEKIETLEVFQTNFKKLLSLLPFADLKTLTINKKVNIAFFINLYNILTIHSLVTWSKLNKGKLSMSNWQRVTYFNMFKYCVGGYIFSLNDIEHGVLRNNNRFGLSKFKTVWAGLITKHFTDTSNDRFTRTDGRKQVVLTDSGIGKHIYFNN